MTVISFLSMILGAIYVLFVPGLALSFAFFRRRTIDAIERAALSFALSIAVVPLVAFYLNLVGIRLTRLSVALEVLGVIVLAGALAWWRERRGRAGETRLGSGAPVHTASAAAPTPPADMSTPPAPAPAPPPVASPSASQPPPPPAQRPAPPARRPVRRRKMDL